MERQPYLAEMQRRLRQFPVVALIGSRQVGKTTFARQFCATLPGFDFDSDYFDLENPPDLARLSQPMLALEPLVGPVIIDEVQQMPELFRILRVLCDRPASRASFVVLGSASGPLLRQSSESIAGRVSVIEIDPLSLDEVETPLIDKLWLRGGYSRSFLARADEDSLLWRESFLRTFIEKDVPALGANVSPSIVDRLWTMLAHRHGQILNASDLGRSFGISHNSVLRALDVLVQTFMVRRLTPWYANLEKRQVKSPKIYIRDAGLLHALLGIVSHPALERHPVLGFSWEGFAMEQVFRARRIPGHRAHFWATHQGAEMDLVVENPDGLEGFEFKYADAPRMTRSIASAIESLDLQRVTIVYPGTKAYRLSDRVEVIPLKREAPQE